MNEKAVKKLTKQGCIVEKDAAESLTEEDISRIEDMDTPPMYLSEKMLSALRSKPVSNGHSNEVDSGSGQKMVQKKEKVAEKDSVETDAESNTKEETDSTKEETEDDNELEAQDESEDKGMETEIDTDDRDHDQENQDLDNAETDEFEKENRSSKFDANKTVRIRDNRREKRVDTKVEVMDKANISKDEKDVPEFLNNYNDRYEQIKNLLLRRMEMKSAVSIQRLSRRDEGEEAAVVGIVNDKYSTSSGKWIIEIEDKTDTFKVLANQRDGERIVPDEILGIRGNLGGDIIYADHIVRPDLPIPNGVNTTKQKVKAAYISDLHLGSIDTLYDRFNRFAKWLNSDQASDIGYLVMPGDVVEGVGTYPGQEEELKVTDIYKQYEMFEDWVDKLPDDLQIIVSPGNHDIVRLAEPQPALGKDVFPRISDYNNVHLVQNPQYVRLHGIRSKGILNLMYHGYSFDDHVDQIQDLREKAYDEPHHVMIDLLKRRHMAPTFGSNLLAPEDKDYLVMDKEPDVMASGHFHSHANESYKGVNVIACSSFQSQTDFQKRVGHEPDPGKVTIVDYKTRNTKVLQF